MASNPQDSVSNDHGLDHADNSASPYIAAADQGAGLGGNEHSIFGGIQVTLPSETFTIILKHAVAALTHTKISKTTGETLDERARAIIKVAFINQSSLMLVHDTLIAAVNHADDSERNAINERERHHHGVDCRAIQRTEAPYQWSRACQGAFRDFQCEQCFEAIKEAHDQKERRFALIKAFKCVKNAHW